MYLLPLWGTELCPAIIFHLSSSMVFLRSTRLSSHPHCSNFQYISKFIHQPIHSPPIHHQFTTHSSQIHQPFITNSPPIHHRFTTHSSPIHHPFTTHSSPTHQPSPPQKKKRNPPTHVSVFAGQVVGELEFVEGDEL